MNSTTSNKGNYNLILKAAGLIKKYPEELKRKNFAIAMDIYG